MSKGKKPPGKPPYLKVVDPRTADDAELDRRAATDPRLAEMNARYAVVRISGKTKVVTLEESPAFPGSRVPVFSSINDFIAFHANERVEVRLAGGGTKRVGLGRWWISNVERRQFYGIVYAPNEQSDDRLNLWTGFGCESVVGDCSLFLAHVRDVICGGNAEYYAYITGWMATAVQYPGRQGEVAIVLRGKEGTGKGVFASGYGRIFGSHFLHIVHAKHLVGNFNAHLQNCSLLYANEAFFAGDRAHESTLKALITEETLLIEPKGVDSYQVRNCVHLIMSSNDRWVVPAGADVRRYLVLDVVDDHMRDTEYFMAIVGQMDSGGREALLHHLLHLDLSGFNLRTVPQTAALDDQKGRSRRGIDRLVEIVVNNGVLPFVHERYPDIAITSGEERGRGFYFAARQLVPELKHESSIIVARTLKDEWGCKPWHDRSRRGIAFPALAALRAAFTRKHGAQDWFQNDVMDWSAAAEGGPSEED